VAIALNEEGKTNAALVEAFRSLRTSILLSTADHPPSSLLVTSTQPGEGKTTIAQTWPLLSRKSANESARGCRFAVTFAAPAVRNARQPRSCQLPTGHQELAYWWCVPRDRMASISCSAVPYLPIHRNFSLPEAWRIDPFRTRTIRVCHSRFGAMLALADSRILATLVSGCSGSENAAVASASMGAESRMTNSYCSRAERINSPCFGKREVPMDWRYGTAETGDRGHAIPRDAPQYANPDDQ